MALPALALPALALLAAWGCGDSTALLPSGDVSPLQPDAGVGGSPGASRSEAPEQGNPFDMPMSDGSIPVGSMGGGSMGKGTASGFPVAEVPKIPMTEIPLEDPPMSPPAATGAIGAACASDADCLGGMACQSEFPLGGVVAGGYCTLPCSDNSECQAADAASVCPAALSSDGNSYCVALCRLGPEVLVAGAPECGLNRPGLACGQQVAEGGVALCEPRCVDDANCGEGLFCDLGSGLCVPTQPEGASVGATCTANAVCASQVCLTANAQDPTEVGFCGGVCRFGSIAGCGFGEEVAEGERGAACVFGAGPGESGLCGALCDTPADCQGEGFGCDPLPPPLVEIWGRAGRCLPPPEPAGAGPDAGLPEEGEAPPPEPADAGAPTGEAPAPPEESPPLPPFTGATGFACESDADCFGGMTCLREFPLGGGVAGGYCALPCSDSAECQAVDAASACPVQPSSDGNRYCLALCLRGPGELVPGAPECGGNRPDLACGQPITPAGVALCEPRCIDDASCGAGSFCNLGTGLCVTAQPEGAALGAPCTADAACASAICLKANPQDPAEVGFCSGLCRFGPVAGCGFGEEVAEGERAAACIFGAAAGDSGLCGALCDSDVDCEVAGFTCGLFEAQGAAQSLGRAGVCSPGQASAN